MAKAKQLKIYTQRGRYLDVRLRNKNFFVRFLLKLAWGVYGFFYAVGLAVLKAGSAAGGAVLGAGRLAAAAVRQTGQILRRDARRAAADFRARRKKISNREFVKNLLAFVLMALIGFGGIGLARFLQRALELKDTISSRAQTGARYLAEAGAAARADNLVSAQEKLRAAMQFFNQGQAALDGQGSLLGQIVRLLPQGRDATRLLAAANLISATGQDLVSLQGAAGQFKLSTAGLVSANGNNSQLLVEIASSFTDALSKARQAAVLLAAVDPRSLPPVYRDQLAALQSQLASGRAGLDEIGQLFNLAQGMLAGRKNVLILFENNNELRPTGGFMGTFGSLQMSDGQVQSLNVSSIYDLDGQLKQSIQAPLPVIGVNQRWFMRDSNWFADFPLSVKKITEFYQLEGGQKPDVVVAMTPDLIIDWLKLTGPVAMPKYGVTLTADNFVEETQAITTISDNMPTNSPKQMLADLVPVLLQRLGAQTQEHSQFLSAVLQNLADKQLVIYSSDPGQENIIQNFDWGGNLLPADRDYLLVLDSNLGATKTNLKISQTTSLASAVQPDGSIIDDLKIIRTNNNPDEPNNSNVSFLRIYVPLGSQLLSNSGFEKRDLAASTSTDLQIDPDVLNWEKNSLTDNLTGTLIGQESGKTFFGNWLTLAPGASSTVELTYKLPFKLADLDRLSLVLQKQLGSNDDSFAYSVSPGLWNRVWQSWLQNAPATAAGYSGIIDRDYVLGMVLRKGN